MSGAGGYINPVAVICPPGQTLGTASLPGARIVSVTTDTTSSPTAPISALQGAQAVSVAAKMHVRGQSSASAQKSQYAVHLTSLLPEGQHFLGMKHGGRHWIFNAPGMARIDLTLLRNVLTFHTQRKLGQWAPRTKYFELFFYQGPAGDDTQAYYDKALADISSNPDSYYRGVYCNMEKIRQQSHRINIPVYSADSTPVGGFIMQLNPGSPEYETMSGSNVNLPYTADVQLFEPKADHFADAAKQAQLGDIRSWYNKSGTAGWGPQFIAANSDPATADWSAIAASTDYASFATYFLLNELANDPDGYHKSTFMYKSPDTSAARGACFAGPMWDKNKSYGNAQLNYKPTYQNVDGWNYTRESGGQSPIWWHTLTKDPGFLSEVLRQWTAANGDGGVLTSAWQSSFIDSQVAYLTTSGALGRNNTLWGVSDYSNQVDALKIYINSRLAWMSDAVPMLCTP